MGLSYRFVLVCPVHHLDRAMTVLADHLVSADHDRLLAARPWEPALAHRPDGAAGPHGHGLRDVARREHESRDGFCFTYRFAIGSDELLRSYDAEMDAQVFQREPDEKARVGCLYTSFGRGQRWLIITASAATSSISRLMAGSASIRATWIAMAEAMGARALFFDEEQDDWWWLLYPDEREAPRPDENAFELVDRIFVRDVDALAEQALVEADLSLDEATWSA
ncbi:MAG: hypothetical protein EOO75_05250 [Myxococcales bacterium]|nr:MAG: hypothetical protein EOO75_05250 [Myxococcales bacterium]